MKNKEIIANIRKRSIMKIKSIRRVERRKDIIIISRKGLWKELRIQQKNRKKVLRKESRLY